MKTKITPVASIDDIIHGLDARITKLEKDVAKSTFETKTTADEAKTIAVEAKEAVEVVAPRLATFRTMLWSYRNVPFGFVGAHHYARMHTDPDASHLVVMYATTFGLLGFGWAFDSVALSIPRTYWTWSAVRLAYTFLHLTIFLILYEYGIAVTTGAGLLNNPIGRSAVYSSSAYVTGRLLTTTLSLYISGKINSIIFLIGCGMSLASPHRAAILDYAVDELGMRRLDRSIAARRPTPMHLLTVLIFVNFPMKVYAHYHPASRSAPFNHPGFLRVLMAACATWWIYALLSGELLDIYDFSSTTFSVQKLYR